MVMSKIFYWIPNNIGRDKSSTIALTSLHLTALFSFSLVQMYGFVNVSGFERKEPTHDSLFLRLCVEFLDHFFILRKKLSFNCPRKQNAFFKIIFALFDLLLGIQSRTKSFISK